MVNKGPQRPPRKTRNWNALSPEYRQRLQRNGIDRRSYNSGVQLSKARGHSKTPERPERAERTPGRYRDYELRRKAEAVALVQVKRDLFGTSSARWSETRALRNALEYEGKPVGLKKLREAASYAILLTDGEIDWSNVPDDIKAILGYH